MARNKTISAKMTEIQNQIIQKKAKELGYKNKSQYAKDMILQDNRTIEKMINEIHEKICNKEE
jgi:hypothetical protein